MGILEVLTIIFVICKLLGVIEWSWWLVFSPEIFAIVMYIIWYVLFILFVRKTTKKVIKEFPKDLW